MNCDEATKIFWLRVWHRRPTPGKNIIQSTSWYVFHVTIRYRMLLKLLKTRNLWIQSVTCRYWLHCYILWYRGTMCCSLWPSFTLYRIIIWLYICGIIWYYMLQKCIISNNRVPKTVPICKHVFYIVICILPLYSKSIIAIAFKNE